MTHKELKQIIAFRGNITASELAQIDNTSKRNARRKKHGLTASEREHMDVMNRAIAEQVKSYPTHSKD